MLRIEPITTAPNARILRLEGCLIGPWVEELKRSCDAHVAGGTRLTLDLSNVSFVDRDGAELLRGLQEHHVVLLNCPPFVAEQLKGWERGHAGCGRRNAG